MASPETVVVNSQDLPSQALPVPFAPPEGETVPAYSQDPAVGGDALEVPQASQAMPPRSGENAQAVSESNQEAGKEVMEPVTESNQEGSACLPGNPEHNGGASGRELEQTLASPLVATEAAATLDCADMQDLQTIAAEASSEDPQQVVPHENPWDTESDEAMVNCKQCGQSVALAQCIMKNSNEYWCKLCNAVTTLLRRHMSWPPMKFSIMTEKDQQTFFQQCHLEKGNDPCFKYSRVRDSLVRSLVRKQMNESRKSVGGTFLPKSVYRKRGYDLPDDFEQNAPREWSATLKEYTYLLPEISVSETEVTVTIEQTVVEAERGIKKRKQKEIAQEASASSAPKATGQALSIVMDLCSDDSDQEVPPGVVWFCSLILIWGFIMTSEHVKKCFH